MCFFMVLFPLVSMLCFGPGDETSGLIVGELLAGSGLATTKEDDARITVDATTTYVQENKAHIRI
jgi:hypothetical protein